MSANRGNVTEAKVLAALVQRDFPVLVPFGDGHPFDLGLLAAGSTFLRVQCKTARPVAGCLAFNSHSTDHGHGRGSYVGLADLFGVYFPPTEAVYLVPVDALARFGGRLRLEPARNNQRKGIRFAADFALERWTPEALAALAPTREIDLSA